MIAPGESSRELMKRLVIFVLKLDKELRLLKCIDASVAVKLH
jgi:hypothetical protein